MSSFWTLFGFFSIHFCSNFGAFWRVRGGPGGGLGAQFGLPGGLSTKEGVRIKNARIFRPILEAKIGSKNYIYVARRAQEPSGELLGRFFGHVGPKSHQKATQNACKILIDFDIDFSSIFHRFWEGFGRSGEGKNEVFAWEKCKFSHFLLLQHKLALDPLKPSIFRPFWEPSWALKTDMLVPRWQNVRTRVFFSGIQKRTIFKMRKCWFVSSFGMNLQRLAGVPIPPGRAPLIFLCLRIVNNI